MDFNSSLTNLIKTNFNIGASDPLFKDLFNATLDHLCNRTNYAQYHKALAATGAEFNENFTPKKFRLLISDCGTVLLNVRFYLLHLLKTSPRKCTAKYAEELFPAYGIRKRDAVQCFRYVRKFRKLALKDNSFMNEFTIEEVSPEKIAQVNRKLLEFTPALMEHARKKAQYQLRFVWSVNNDSAQSMAIDLYIRAVYAYKKMSPQVLNVTDEHALNKLRTAINNESANVANANSTQKRARMVNVGKDNKENAQYVLIVESQSQFREMEDGSIPELGEYAIEPAQKKMIRDLDVAVTRLCDKHKGSRRGELLNIIFNRKIKKFMKFLRRKEVITLAQMDTIDVVTRMGRPKFFRLLAEYLGLKVEVINDYVDSLSAELNVKEVVYA